MSNKSPIAMFEELVNIGECLIYDGITLVMDNVLNIKIYKKNGNPFIEFNTPKPILVVEKFGVGKLISKFKPTVNHITFHPDMISISIDRFPDVTIQKSEL